MDTRTKRQWYELLHAMAMANRLDTVAVWIYCDAIEESGERLGTWAEVRRRQVGRVYCSSADLNMIICCADNSRWTINCHVLGRPRLLRAPH